MIASTKPGERLLGGHGYILAWDIGEKKEPTYIGTSEEHRPREARREQVDRGVLEGVISTNAGDQGGIEESGHGEARRIIADGRHGADTQGRAERNP